jgi:hypothetical protein
MGYGDDLMVAGEAREARVRDPRKVAVWHINGRRQRWSAVFENNPNMATVAEVRASRDDAFQWLDQDAGRRYRLAETAERRTWTQVGPTRPEIYLTVEERAWAAAQQLDGAVLVEPTIKPNASPNKDWGWENWEALITCDRAQLWVQLGAPGARRLRGARFVECPSFRHAVAALERVASAVLPEGGLHHGAAAVNRRVVVIFGGYISPVQTGYEDHENVFTGVVPCGYRRPCEHCRESMEWISPAGVMGRLIKLLIEREALPA